jgi:hypothetical protein
MCTNTTEVRNVGKLLCNFHRSGRSPASTVARRVTRQCAEIIAIGGDSLLVSSVNFEYKLWSGSSGSYFTTYMALRLTRAVTHTVTPITSCEAE